jgi:hypothetical protein
MASGIYNQFKTDLFSGLNHLQSGGDSFVVALYLNTFAFTATDTTYATTNEVAEANGYLRGVKALGGQAISGTTTKLWTATPTVWTSSGAGFTARFAVIFNATNSNKLCVCVDFGSDKTASGGGTFTITWDAGGIISLA